MKVLSLTQPWATLVVNAMKHFETRSWKTNHTGLLIIHASQRFPRIYKELLEYDPFLSALNCSPDELPLGSIIGAVILKRCWRTEDVVVTSAERSFGDYGPDRWAWEFENARQFQPIPCKGALGLWTPTSDVEQLVTECIKI